MTQQAPQVQDKLKRLVHEELPREMKRLGEASDIDTKGVVTEVARTVLPMLLDMGRELLALREWSAYAHKNHADLIDDFGQRTVMLEAVAYGADSQLTADDAALFERCVLAAETFAEEAMKTTFDPTGKEKLQAILDDTKAARARIEEIVLVDDDDDGDDDDGDAQSPPADTTVVPTAAPSASAS